jgi:hypothetical protein
VSVTRHVQGRDERAEVDLKVLSVINPDDPTALSGYVDVGLLDLFEQYVVSGAAVPELGWPAGGSQPAARFRSFLLITRREDDYTADDLEYLRRTFRGHFTDVTDRPPEALVRLLRPEKRDELRFYEASSQAALADPNRGLEDPDVPGVFNEEKTLADEVVVPWNEPLTGQVGGEPWTLVGLAAPRLGWLRPYLREAAQLPKGSEQPFRLRVAEGPERPWPKSVAWPLGGGQQLSLDVLAEGVGPAPAGGVVAVVLPEVLAWLTFHRQGGVEFDPATRLFKAPPPPPHYNRARLYATSIDEVPVLTDTLFDRHFSVRAEQALIREIHKQDASLQLLVVVVGAGVFLFGVVTVVSVLLDSTNRKRGTIGILRVMGTSRVGIFLTIFIRAAAIGLLAAGLSIGLGYLLAHGLSWSPAEGSAVAAWKPVLSVELQPRDCLVVLGGSLACCALGALWPAWRASRLDPFDAIVEGRFR